MTFIPTDKKLFGMPTIGRAVTDFIFNAGTPISASAKSVSGGNDAYVSLKIQVI